MAYIVAYSILTLMALSVALCAILPRDLLNWVHDLREGYGWDGWDIPVVLCRGALIVGLLIWSLGTVAHAFDHASNTPGRCSGRVSRTQVEKQI